MKKIVTFFLACLMCVPMIGCKNKKNDPNTLYIELSNAGFGTHWIEPLVDIFEAEHDGVTVEVTPYTKRDGDMINRVLSGESEADIIFVESFIAVDEPVKSGGVTYSSPYADITDIYKANVPGEDITLENKMDSSYRELHAHTVDNETKYYSTPWMQGPMGIAINNRVYKESYGKLPNTTNEMLTFCEKVKNAGAIPFIHSADTSYFDDIYDVWMTQYNGRENQKKWWQGYALSGDDAGKRYSPSMFEDDGLRYSLKFLESLLKPAKGYCSSKSNLDFTRVQNVFLEGSDNILFMPTGAWLEREMEANYDKGEIDVDFIKMPVISALGTKLGISDGELSAIVDYVDGTVATEPEFTSSKNKTKEEVVQAVREARNMTPSLHEYYGAIPAYSTKVSLAKEFLQLMATNRGMEAMLKDTGLCAPYKYDVTTSPVKDDLSKFMYSVNVLAEKGYVFFPKDKLFTANVLTYVNNSGRIGAVLSSNDENYYKTADQLITRSVTYVSGMWQSYMNKL